MNALSDQILPRNSTTMQTERGGVSDTLRLFVCIEQCEQSPSTVLPKDAAQSSNRPVQVANALLIEKVYRATCASGKHLTGTESADTTNRTCDENTFWSRHCIEHVHVINTFLVNRDTIERPVHVVTPCWSIERLH